MARIHYRATLIGAQLGIAPFRVADLDGTGRARKCSETWPSGSSADCASDGTIAGKLSLDMPPDLPGCVAVADTREEAIDLIRGAIDKYGDMTLSPRKWKKGKYAFACVVSVP